MRNKDGKISGLAVALALIGAILLVVGAIAFEPAMIRFENWRSFRNQVAHDQTDYNTLRRVEDQARAMLATWHGDVAQFEAFRDSTDSHERSIANAALIRANRTASTFNNFILTNSFVWAYGVPDDIAEELPLISRQE